MSSIEPEPVPQPTVNPSNVAEQNADGEDALFVVATHKFIILSICTFGLYERYWCYENWVRLAATSRETISPIWRAVFSPIWNFSLFTHIRDLAATRKVTVSWSAGSLGTLYLISTLLWRLPDPWFWIGFVSVLAFVPVLGTVRQINNLHRAAGVANQNSKYSVANIVTIAVGGIVVLFGIVGTFFPE